MYLCGVGVLGPGLQGWTAARRILGGEEPYCYAPAPEPRAETLPQNERRRGARTVRWAMAVAVEAVREAGIPPAQIASVFASSSGDGEVLHQICEALAAPGQEVSPTRFHNSVHNAAAGYWTIASAARRTSITVCGHDSSFAAGLLEAAALVHAEERAVLFVAYDLPYPQPLLAVRAIREPLAVAVVLSGEPGPRTMARWQVGLGREAAPRQAADALPGELASNPAAQALPLLAAAARRATRTIRVPHFDGQLIVDCRP